MLPELRSFSRTLQQRISLCKERTSIRLGSTCRHSSSLNRECPEEPVTRCETPFTVFDTAKNRKCKLTTKRPEVLTWYSCGPTVYDSAHIGHAASFIRQDVIRRVLEYQNKKLTVIQVMGITDIDDKIIRKAAETNSDWKEISRHYEKEFIEDLTNLGVVHPHIFTRVSDYIPQILRFVGNLVRNGFAYPVEDGSVYFNTKVYGDRYGVFRQASSVVDGELEEESSDKKSGKRNVRDFAVWKGAKAGEPYWESPWGTSGKGRPGWHIECSVMASEMFGHNLDLHTGGKDLIFPHHENEEAQCCAHHGCPEWSSHWMHMGHLHFKGDVKMSKSLGNTVSIGSFLEKYSPDVLRLMCIVSRYRNDIEYSPNSIDNAQKILRKFNTFLNDTSAILGGTKLVKGVTESATLWEKLIHSKNSLNVALVDDFDTAEVVKLLTEFISDFNRHFEIVVESKTSPNITDFELVLASKLFVQNVLNALGISEKQGKVHSAVSGNSESTNREFETVVDKFVKFRNDVRSFSLAFQETDKDARKLKMKDRVELLRECDKVRNELLTENNIEIKDHANQSSWNFVQKKEHE